MDRQCKVYPIKTRSFQWYLRFARHIKALSTRRVAFKSSKIRIVLGSALFINADQTTSCCPSLYRIRSIDTRGRISSAPTISSSPSLLPNHEDPKGQRRGLTSKWELTVTDTRKVHDTQYTEVQITSVLMRCGHHRSMVSRNREPCCRCSALIATRLFRGKSSFVELIKSSSTRLLIPWRQLKNIESRTMRENAVTRPSHKEENV